MHDLPQLWLPIIVSAVGVFIASSLIHMVFKWHNSDYRKLANEDEVLAALRNGSPTPGQYTLPHCSDMKQMQEAAMHEKFRIGPTGFIVVRKSGMPGMGGTLLKWFLLCLVVAALAACLAVQVLGLQANPRYAGHLVGMVTFMAYATGSFSNGIWFAKPWPSVAKDLLDALIYGTVSALTFMWLWP